MEWLKDVRDWFSGMDGAVQATVIGTLIAGLALLWTIVWNIFTHFSKRNNTNRDPLLEKAVETLSLQLEAKEQALTTLREREQSLLADLREAVLAVPKQTAIPDAKARIKEALEEAAKGHTELAEAIFSEVETRKAAEGTSANKEAVEAVEAARHQATLVFLHDTGKALESLRAPNLCKWVKFWTQALLSIQNPYPS